MYFQSPVNQCLVNPSQLVKLSFQFKLKKSLKKFLFLSAFFVYKLVHRLKEKERVREEKKKLKQQRKEKDKTGKQKKK